MAAWKSSRLWLGSLLICSWAASASADECQKNEDCPRGFSCEASIGASDCDAAPPCAPGEACPEPASCDAPVEVHSCQPTSCASDADCGDGMVCFKETYTECSGTGGAPACGPGEACALPAPPPDEPTCSEQKISLCIPRYLLPCQQDTDCGAGFSCEAGTECECSGSAGDVADAGTSVDFAGAAPVPYDGGIAPTPAQDAAVGGPEPTCECRPTERKHCELEVMRCSSDADCPGDFACKSYGDDAVSCSSGDAGAVMCASGAAVPSELRCVPRYDWPTRGGSNGEDSASEDPAYEAADPDAGVVAPQLPADDDSAENAATCSVTTPRAGTPGLWLAPFAGVLAVLGMRSRRRSR